MTDALVRRREYLSAMMRCCLFPPLALSSDCAGFEFLEYGKPEVQEPVMDTEWEPGHEIKSIIRCNVLADGVDMKCGVSADNAKDVAVSIAMERQFSLTADITVSVRMAAVCSLNRQACRASRHTTDHLVR